MQVRAAYCHPAYLKELPFAVIFTKNPLAQNCASMAFIHTNKSSLDWAKKKKKKKVQKVVKKLSKSCQKVQKVVKKFSSISSNLVKMNKKEITIFFED
jgi:hypothetical protein